jgi:hypothetical protein
LRMMIIVVMILRKRTEDEADVNEDDNGMR